MGVERGDEVGEGVGGVVGVGEGVGVGVGRQLHLATVETCPLLDVPVNEIVSGEHGRLEIIMSTEDFFWVSCPEDGLTVTEEVLDHWIPPEGIFEPVNFTPQLYVVSVAKQLVGLSEPGKTDNVTVEAAR